MLQCYCSYLIYPIHDVGGLPSLLTIGQLKEPLHITTVVHSAVLREAVSKETLQYPLGLLQVPLREMGKSLHDSCS